MKHPQRNSGHSPYLLMAEQTIKKMEIFDSSFIRSDVIGSSILKETSQPNLTRKCIWKSKFLFNDVLNWRRNGGSGLKCLLDYQ